MSNSRSQFAEEVQRGSPAGDPATAGVWFHHARYDLAGNIEQVKDMSRSFTYDAESRIKTAMVDGKSASYEYDGDGRRVKMTDSRGATYYVYDGSGALAMEQSPGTVGSGLEYLSGDHLGSTRLVTAGAGIGNALKSYDYLPFGEELRVGFGGRTDSSFPSMMPSFGVATEIKVGFTGK